MGIIKYTERSCIMDKRELFVKNLRKIMDIKGKTQTDIAKGMGKPLTTVSPTFSEEKSKKQRIG